MNEPLFHAYYDATGNAELEAPIEWHRTPPLPSRFGGRWSLVGLVCRPATGSTWTSQRFDAAWGVRYDVSTGTAERIDLARTLDETQFPRDATPEEIDEYIALLDAETPVFFKTGRLPSLDRWALLTTKMFGPRTWLAYVEIAPDLEEVLGPPRRLLGAE